MHTDTPSWTVLIGMIPFMPNGISHPFQSDQFISVLKVAGSVFLFYSYLTEIL